MKKLTSREVMGKTGSNSILKRISVTHQRWVRTTTLTTEQEKEKNKNLTKKRNIMSLLALRQEQKPCQAEEDIRLPTVALYTTCQSNICPQGKRKNDWRTCLIVTFTACPMLSKACVHKQIHTCMGSKKAWS